VLQGILEWVVGIRDARPGDDDEREENERERARQGEKEGWA